MDSNVSPEEREIAFSMVYEHIGRNGGLPWDELGDAEKQRWRDFVRERERQSMEQLAALDDLAKSARPLSEMEGESDGAALVGGQTYLMKDGQLYGPQETLQ